MLDVSGNMTDTRMTALKTALTDFINQVYERSSGSRIAMVQFSQNSCVLTNESHTAVEDALVTVKTGKDSLNNIVTNLTADSNKDSSQYSNSDQAMFDALKIFQSANNDNETDDLGQKYSERTRVSILFSAGLPGKGKNSNGKESAWTGWDISARNSAQATMSLATILKYGEINSDGTRATKVFTDAENNSKCADSSPWSTLSANYVGLSYVGCGSTVYTVGLNLDNATDPSTLTSSTLKDFADISGNTLDFKIETRQAALINEYLYRVSSHRPTGEHFTYNDENLETSFKNKFDSLPSVGYYGNYYSVKSLYSKDNNGLYYFYPDALTRDLPNGYFLTADDNHLDRLSNIFNQIAVQVGDKFEGLSVRDYIDSAFVPVSVDSNGVIHELAEGDTVGTSVDGKYVGTLKKDKDDTKGWYIEWSDVKLSPESFANKGDAKTFNESIYVKPVDGMIGCRTAS